MWVGGIDSAHPQGNVVLKHKEMTRLNFKLHKKIFIKLSKNTELLIPMKRGYDQNGDIQNENQILQKTILVHST